MQRLLRQENLQEFLPEIQRKRWRMLLLSHLLKH